MVAFLRGTQPKLLLHVLLISSPFSVACAQNRPDEAPPAATTGWKIKFDGSGSSPVSADGVLYVGSADGAVYALDPKTGATKWRFQTGESLSSGPQVVTVPRGTSVADQVTAGLSAAKGQIATGTRRVDMTPAIENGTVFIGAGDRSFYAIDAATGKQKWSYAAGGGMASKINTSYPVPAPIVNDGTVYCITQDGLHAIDVTTGRRKWLFETLTEIPDRLMNDVRNLGKRTAKGPIQSAGLIFLTAWPYMLSTTPQKSFLYAVAPESGSARWVAALDGRDITEPVVARGLVFVAVKDPRSEPRPGYPLGVDSNHTTLYAINAADGQVRWKIAADSNYSSQRLLAADNVIYLATDKRLVAAEPETGRLLWSSSAEGVLHLAADRQRLYLVAHRGSDARLHALAFATGQENWSQGLSGGAGLVVHEGVAYAGTDAVDGATGRKLWSFKGTGRESVQLISGGRAFLISETVTYSGSRRVDDGYLYAIDARTGKP